MLDVIGCFTFQEKVTLLAWHAEAQGRYAQDDLQAKEVIDAKDWIDRAVATSALIAGLCTGNTTDQEILDFAEKYDFTAQLEFLYDCRTQEEFNDMDKATIAAFQLCVKLGAMKRWEPWEPC